MHAATSAQRVVLHIDIDSFFCQVEEQKRGGVKGRPVAIQQHQDIIAVNYPARALGVAKHMRPAEARKILHANNGCILPVHMEAGHRVSYGPYRAVSRAMIKLLKGMDLAEVVEKASIDEAFVQLRPRLLDGCQATPDVASIRRSVAAIRNAVKQSFGLTASVGVAHNKLLAKLASGRAKPDGVLEVLAADDVAAMLAATPAARMPGCGGKIGAAFAGAGIDKIPDLQAWSETDMRQTLGVAPDAAAKLYKWCRGRDDAPVAERPPPKTLSVQMSLTPELLAMHPAQMGTPSVAGDSGAMLEPLPVGADNYRARCSRVLAAMGGDLLGRILVDREEEGRWPSTFTLLTRFMGGGADNSRFVTRSTSFPAPSLADVPFRDHGKPQAAGGDASRQQGAAFGDAGIASSTAGLQPWSGTAKSSCAVEQQQQQRRQQRQNQRSQPPPVLPAEHAASGQPVDAQPRDALEAAVRSNAEAMCRSASARQPPAAKLVEVRLLATNFTTAATAAGPSIRQYFAAGPAGKRRKQEAHPQQRQDGSTDSPAAPGGSHSNAEALVDSKRQPPAADKMHLPAAAAPVEADRAGRSAAAAVPVAADIASVAASQHQAEAPAGCAQGLGALSGQVQQHSDSTICRNASEVPTDVDVSSIDVEEQRRILRQLQAAAGGKPSGSGSRTAASGSRKPDKAGARGQRSILQAFQKAKGDVG